MAGSDIRRAFARRTRRRASRTRSKQCRRRESRSTIVRDLPHFATVESAVSATEDCRIVGSRLVSVFSVFSVVQSFLLVAHKSCGVVIATLAAYPAGMSQPAMKYAERFRGFLPVVVDVETGGFDCERDALREIAVIVVRMDEQGVVHPDPVVSTHVVPFPGANIAPRSLEITGIDPTHPFRAAVEE